MRAQPASALQQQSRIGFILMGMIAAHHCAGRNRQQRGVICQMLREARAPSVARRCAPADALRLIEHGGRTASPFGVWILTGCSAGGRHMTKATAWSGTAPVSTIKAPGHR